MHHGLLFISGQKWNAKNRLKLLNVQKNGNKYTTQYLKNAFSPFNFVFKTIILFYRDLTFTLTDMPCGLVT